MLSYLFDIFVFFGKQKGHELNWEEFDLKGSVSVMENKMLVCFNLLVSKIAKEQWCTCLYFVCLWNILYVILVCCYQQVAVHICTYVFM